MPQLWVPGVEGTHDDFVERLHRHIERLAREADAPVHQLPFLFAPQLERAHVERLADELADAL